MALVITAHVEAWLTATLDAQVPDQSKPAPALQPPAIADGTQQVVIDAISGMLVTGKRTYGLRDRVVVVLKDINPFVFSYRLDVRGTRVVEASPAEFFDVALGIKVPATVNTTPGATSGVQTLSASSAQPAAKFTALCPGNYDVNRAAQADALAGELSEEFQDLALKSSKLQGAFINLGAALSPIESVIRKGQIDILDASLRAPAVQTAAISLDEALRNADVQLVRTANEVNTQLPVLTHGTVHYAAGVDGANATYPECRAFSGLLAPQTRRLAADTLQYTSLLKIIAERHNKTARAVDILRTVATDQKSFYATYELPRYSGPTDVSILLLRRARSFNQLVEQRTAPPSSDPTKQPPPVRYDTIASHALNVGGRGRFAIGIGLAWSDMATRAYPLIREYATPRDLASPDSLVTVVGMPEVSWNRVLPIIMLHTRLIDLEKTRVLDGLHATLGIGAKETDPTKIEYLVGGALSLFGDRMFTAFGAHIGRTQQLGADLRIGDRLPSGVMSAPIRSRTAVRPGVSLSFRVLPWSTIP